MCNKLLSKLGSYAFLGLASLIMITPLVWLITTAFKTKMEIFANPLRVLPESFSLANFIDAWSYAPFGDYYRNTIVITFALLGVQIITITMAAYAFARLDFPGRDVLFVLFLTQLMITPQSTVFPNYLTISSLRLVDTKLGVMLPYFSSAFGTFMLRQAFLSIPQALEDAARIDGCTIPQVIWHVMLPVVKPTLIAFSIISTTYHWNEFLWPLIVTETVKSRTLTVGLTIFAQQAEGGAEWSLLMAATLIVTLPLLLGFMFFQRRFVESFVSSGLKG